MNDRLQCSVRFGCQVYLLSIATSAISTTPLDSGADLYKSWLGDQCRHPSDENYVCRGRSIGRRPVRLRHGSLIDQTAIDLTENRYSDAVATTALQTT